jgi:hypothetical protein
MFKIHRQKIKSHLELFGLEISNPKYNQDTGRYICSSRFAISKIKSCKRAYQLTYPDLGKGLKTKAILLLDNFKIIPKPNTDGAMKSTALSVLQI